jgi:hypothetical protein
MKIQHRNIIRFEDEVQELEGWGTAMNLPNLNQALKHCIQFTIKHTKPKKHSEK